MAHLFGRARERACARRRTATINRRRNENVWMNIYIHFFLLIRCAITLQQKTANGYWVRRLQNIKCAFCVFRFIVCSRRAWMAMWCGTRQKNTLFFSSEEKSQLSILREWRESQSFVSFSEFSLHTIHFALLAILLFLWLNSTWWFRVQSMDVKWKRGNQVNECNRWLRAGKATWETRNAVFIHKNYCILTCLIFISISMTTTPANRHLLASRHSCDSHG